MLKEQKGKGRFPKENLTREEKMNLMGKKKTKHGDGGFFLETARWEESS